METAYSIHHPVPRPVRNRRTPSRRRELSPMDHVHEVIRPAANNAVSYWFAIRLALCEEDPTLAPDALNTIAAILASGLLAKGE